MTICDFYNKDTGLEDEGGNRRREEHRKSTKGNRINRHVGQFRNICRFKIKKYIL